jgi:hypothetical protein
LKIAEGDAEHAIIKRGDRLVQGQGPGLFSTDWRILAASGANRPEGIYTHRCGADLVHLHYSGAMDGAGMLAMSPERGDVVRGGT